MSLSQKSLSQKFVEFRRRFAAAGRRLRSLQGREGATARGNRWTTIGRTRRRLAEILTAYARTIEGPDGTPRFPDAVVLPERVRPMRLVGRVRAWEDAHSWEATATWPDGGTCWSFYSFDTMTACVRAGRVRPVGKDGEVSA